MHTGRRHAAARAGSDRVAQRRLGDTTIVLPLCLVAAHSVLRPRSESRHPSLIEGRLALHAERPRGFTAVGKALLPSFSRFDPCLLKPSLAQPHQAHRSRSGETDADSGCQILDRKHTELADTRTHVAVLQHEAVPQLHGLNNPAELDLGFVRLDSPRRLSLYMGAFGRTRLLSSSRQGPATRYRQPCPPAPTAQSALRRTGRSRVGSHHAQSRRVSDGFRACADLYHCPTAGVVQIWIAPAL